MSRTRSTLGLLVLMIIPALVAWPVSRRLGLSEKVSSSVPEGLRREVLSVEEYQLEMDHLLHNYAWMSRDQGLVRVPIEVAMQTLLGRGLPTRTAAEVAPLEKQ